MYNIGNAQKHLEKLLREARSGKEVILARRNTPVAKLVALPAKIRKKATSRST
jgi:prevent-host-death family protein